MAIKEKKPNKIDWSFLEIEPQDRRNSQNIRRLIFDVLLKEFDRDCEAASQKLAQATNSKDSRAYDKPISANGFRRVVRDEISITFQHLNAFAKFYGIPISTMLLFTRIRDELENVENRDASDALHILNGITAVIGHLKGIVQNSLKSDKDILRIMNHDAFREYVHIYKNAVEASAQQLELPME